MNKRIRKKQLKRTLRNMLAAYNEYETARERAFRRAVQRVVNAYGKSPEAPSAAFRCCMEMAALMASSGPPPKLLTEYGHGESHY